MGILGLYRDNGKEHGNYCIVYFGQEVSAPRNVCG